MKNNWLTKTGPLFRPDSILDFQGFPHPPFQEFFASKILSLPN